MAEQLKSIIECMAVWKVRNDKTDDDLAKALGITRESLRMKKNGSRPFKMSELSEMCSIFGCDPNTLMGYTK